LHSYIRPTLLLLNPTDFDEVCVQAIHLESRGKDTKNGSSMEFSQQKGSKNKGKEKQVATIKKEEANLTCMHCKKSGHDEDRCWKLHPKLRPKKYGGKGKKKVVVIFQQDFGSESGDETQITTIGVVNGSKTVSMISAKASEGYDNEIVKLSPSHEVFQNFRKFPHEGPLHAGDRDFVRERRNVVNSLSVTFICSLLFLIWCAWPVVENMNADRCGSPRMIYYVSIIISSFILVIQLIVMSQVVQAWGRDT
jgi:putative Ca2+/H+ antiporter (TMEM165/GDT1 family)